MGSVLPKEGTGKSSQSNGGSGVGNTYGLWPLRLRPALAARTYIGWGLLKPRSAWVQKAWGREVRSTAECRLGSEGASSRNRQRATREARAGCCLPAHTSPRTRALDEISSLPRTAPPAALRKLNKPHERASHCGDRALTFL